MFISHTLSKTSRANYLLFLANLMVLCFKNYHMYYPDASPLMSPLMYRLSTSLQHAFISIWMVSDEKIT